MVTTFKDYLQLGQLQTKIRSVANERVPPVPELFKILTKKTSFVTDGTFENLLDDPEARVEAVPTTIRGQLDVTGLNPSSFNLAQENQTKIYFRNAITTSLDSGLPQGFTVKVISLETGQQRRLALVVNRKITYVITIFGFNSSADAKSAANMVIVSLDNVSTFEAIASSVNSALASSVNLALNFPRVVVKGNTRGASTESIAAMVTTSGQLSTSLKGLSLSEKAEVADYFKSAIAATLREEGELPVGAFVTAMLSETGVMSYIITMYLDPGADNAIVVNMINSELSSDATWMVISIKVASEAIAANSKITAVSTVSVTGFTQGVSKGVSFKPWYPDWNIEGNHCANNGNIPPFMTSTKIQNQHIFKTQPECCKTWFSYATDECVGGSKKDSAVHKFFPDWMSNSKCSKKLANEFKAWDQKRYDMLEECCSMWFSYAKQTCCDLPGVGGCGGAGVIVFIPDWKSNKCVL
jgi:hypothetical protein